jgi:hypothetical protein
MLAVASNDELKAVVHFAPNEVLTVEKCKAPRLTFMNLRKIRKETIALGWNPGPISFEARESAGTR